MKPRTVVKIEGENKGEKFVETDQRDWETVYERWQNEANAPAPMPVGHQMFKHPEQYGCAEVRASR